MKNNLNITIQHASPSDAESIYKIQLAAFSLQAKIYMSHDLPALTETLQEFKNNFSKYIYLKAIKNKTITGSVRGLQKNNICHIERLIVHPDYQNAGIGKLLMHKIEENFKDTKKFELFTGHLSEKNIQLYENIGYKILRQEIYNDVLTIVYMQKNNK